MDMISEYITIDILSASNSVWESESESEGWRGGGYVTTIGYTSINVRVIANIPIRGPL